MRAKNQLRIAVDITKGCLKVSLQKKNKRADKYF